MITSHNNDFQHAQIDREALHDFMDGLAELTPRIERDIASLKRAPRDKVIIANLFRALHMIKGDAAMCRVEPAVQIVHPLESLLARLRSGDIEFSEPLAETMLLALDRLEIVSRTLVELQPIDQLKLGELLRGLHAMVMAPAKDIDTAAAQVIEAITGFQVTNKTSSVRMAGSTHASTMGSAAEDLKFFRTLALQYEARSPLFKGRSARQLHLALETNKAGGNPVDPVQFEAAVYMHDIGMLFISEASWLKADRLSEKERRQLHEHPVLGAELLRRMPGWEDAATIVLQHHERQDGTGYPQGLTHDRIVPGAKIMAIVDTFESVTLKHRQRGHGRSLIRAIAEINASDTQFAPEWIAPFNRVIRRMVEG